MQAPPLPPGRPIDLPDRGTTFIRELSGPPGTPTLFLLHGWMASADLNWFAVYPGLAGHYGFITIDHRGHGQGIRSRRRFRLDDCADDAVAVMDVLGIDSVIPVGYSMGGPIAQLMWRRHRARVDGLVLCATSRNFAGSPMARARFSAFPPIALAGRLTPATMRQRALERMMVRRNGGDSGWFHTESLRHDPLALAEAGGAIGRFTSHEWIGEVDVPTAVVITENDTVIPPHRQEKLARAIPGATIHRVPGTHTVCATEPSLFLPVLRDACSSVATRIHIRADVLARDDEPLSS